MNIATLQQQTVKFYARSSATQRWIAVIVVVLVGWFTISSIARAHHRSQPEYVLEIVDHMNTPADVERYSEYLTPKGRGIVLWLLAKGGNQPSSSAKPVMSPPAIRGNVCDIAMGLPDTSFTCRLAKTSRWQLDDIYLNTAGKQNIGLWVSYMKEHPVRTYLRLNWKELGGAFLKGAAIGAAAAGG